MVEQSPAADTALQKRKSVIGVRMTVLYSVLYGGFVALSVFRPTWMGARGVFGLNLAVSYGIGLILAAVILALVYNLLCRVPKVGPKPDGKEG